MMDDFTLMALDTTGGDLHFLRKNRRFQPLERPKISEDILTHVSMEGQLMDMMEGKEHFRPFFNSEGIDDRELDFNRDHRAVGLSNVDEWARLLNDLLFMDRMPTYPKPFEINRSNRMLYGSQVEYKDPRDIRDGVELSHIRKWKTDGAIANIIGEIPFFSDPREWLYLRNTLYSDKQLNFDKTFRHMLDNGVWVLPEWGTERIPNGQEGPNKPYGKYDIWSKDERFVGPIFFESIFGGDMLPNYVELIEDDVKGYREIEIVFIQGWVKVPYVANHTISKRYGLDFMLEKLGEKILSITEMVAVDYNTGEYLGFIDDIMNYSSGQTAYEKFKDHPYGFPNIELSTVYYENQTPRVHYNRKMSGNYWGWATFGLINVSASHWENLIENSLNEEWAHLWERGFFPLPFNTGYRNNLMVNHNSLNSVNEAATVPHYLSIPNGARNGDELIKTDDYLPVMLPDDLLIPDVNVKPNSRPEGSIDDNFFYTKAEIMLWEGLTSETYEYTGAIPLDYDTYKLSHGLKNPASLYNRVQPALHSYQYNPNRFFDESYEGSVIDNYIPDGISTPKYNQWRIDAMDSLYPIEWAGVDWADLDRFMPLPDDIQMARLNGSYIHVLIINPAYEGEFDLAEVHFNESHEPVVKHGNQTSLKQTAHHVSFPDNYNYEREAEVFNMFNPRIATRGITIYDMEKIEVQRLFLSFWEMTWSDWKDFFLSKSTDGILNLKWYYGLGGDNVKVITHEGGFTGEPEPIRIGNKVLSHNPLPDDDRVNPQGKVLDFEFVEMTFKPFVVPVPHPNSAGGSPHTTMDLYLPFYGYYKLDVDSVVGEVLFVKYVISIFTGIASIRIYQGNPVFIERDEIALREHALLDVLQAEMSVDIPIDAQANETFTMKVANSMIQRPAMMIPGPAAVVNAGMGAMEAVKTPSRTDVTRVGGLSPEHSILAPLELRLLITTPKYVYDNYDIKGKPHMEVGKLSDFTSGDYVQFDSFKDVQTTGEHKHTEDILELLKGGVFV